MRRDPADAPSRDDDVGDSQQPSPSEWRTAPLWGVADSAPYLHDGRAAGLEAAIQLHGGEASGVTEQFTALSPADRLSIISFLKTLRARAPSETNLRRKTWPHVDATASGVGFCLMAPAGWVCCPLVSRGFFRDNEYLRRQRSRAVPQGQNASGDRNEAAGEDGCAKEAGAVSLGLWRRRTDRIAGQADMARRKRWYDPDAAVSVQVISHVDRDVPINMSRWRHARVAPSLTECLVYPLKDGPGLGLLILLPPVLWFLSLPIFDIIAVMQPLTKSDWALGLLIVPVLIPVLFSFAMTFGYALLFLGHVLVSSALGENRSSPLARVAPRRHLRRDLPLVLGGPVRRHDRGNPGGVLLAPLRSDRLVRLGRLRRADHAGCRLRADGPGGVALAREHHRGQSNHGCVIDSRVWAWPTCGLAWSPASPWCSPGWESGACFTRCPACGWKPWRSGDSGCSSLYGAMVTLRMMGLTYHAHALDLSWFRRRPRWASSRHHGQIYVNS